MNNYRDKKRVSYINFDKRRENERKADDYRTLGERLDTDEQYEDAIQYYKSAHRYYNNAIYYAAKYSEIDQYNDFERLCSKLMQTENLIEDARAKNSTYNPAKRQERAGKKFLNKANACAQDEVYSDAIINYYKAKECFRKASKQTDRSETDAKLRHSEKIKEIENACRSAKNNKEVSPR